MICRSLFFFNKKTDPGIWMHHMEGKKQGQCQGYTFRLIIYNSLSKGNSNKNVDDFKIKGSNF